MNLNKINKNEIWLTKKSFIDINGNEVNSEHEFIIFIVLAPESINDEEFVRVQPISKQIESRTDEDIFIDDESILGYPFIIETWNEQPILTKLLHKKLGSISNLSVDVIEPNEFSENQLSFRKSEIKRTAFLRQSVLSNIVDPLNSYKQVAQVANYASWTKSPVFAYAAIIIGVVFILWQPHKYSNEEFLAFYLEKTPMELSFNAQNQLVRGDGISIEGFSLTESDIIQLALIKYNDGDYLASSELFSQVPDLFNHNIDIYFYAGLSDLYANNTARAIISFEKLALEKREFTKKSRISNDDVLYFLALAYVQNGAISNARSLLNKITSNSPDYLKDKPNILGNLRWF
ncbi:hypothetical protein N9I98_01125 [Flavobacteriales bacterium]|nr:hypothetical protein [Flavobacteriales bacterium]